MTNNNTQEQETGGPAVRVKMSRLTEGIGIVFTGILTMLEALDADTAKTLVEGFVQDDGETAGAVKDNADTVPGNAVADTADTADTAKDAAQQEAASGSAQSEQTAHPEQMAHPEQTAKTAKTDPGLTVDDVARIVVQKVKANPGITENIRALVIAHGAQRVSDLKPENLEAFLTDLSQL